MNDERDPQPGLGDEPRSAWPSVRVQDPAQRPIDRLVPNSEIHRRVLEYLNDRIRASQREMSRFYSRWRANEMKAQAYISLSDHDQALRELNSAKGKAPKAVSVILPYTYATQSTIVTYLLHTFCGRRPIFQVSSNQAERVDAAGKMEELLQYNADRNRMVRLIWQWMNDGELYGLGVVQTAFTTEWGMRTTWTEQTVYNMYNQPVSVNKVRQRSQQKIYQGNIVRNIDPFMFFPDPRVPMYEVNKRGEYVFWRSFEGKHALKKREADGEIKWVDYVPRMTRSFHEGEDNPSNRGLLSQGIAHPGSGDEAGRQAYYQQDQGTVEIIPAEIGLGPSRRPEKWLFTILNGKQIVQAEPYIADHGMHPVAVIEPYAMGYGFGQPGLADYLAPMQDTISWFVNSRIYNVRTVLNNMLVVDPSMVEMQDLKNPEPGKLIRLKRTAIGQDVRMAVSQLAVQDVTTGHMKDIELFKMFGDSLSSVNDNLRGLQESGGRKTATEVRTSGESGASRLAAKARIISAMGVVDLTEQMSLNLQQYLEDDFYLRVVGEDGIQKPLRVSPDQIVGDFYYPINDGTLPLDRVALLEVWKEIFQAILADPQLRQTHDVPKLFDWIAELGGARNIEMFKLQTGSPEQMMAQAQAGNVVPIGATAPPLPASRDGQRMLAGV